MNLTWIPAASFFLFAAVALLSSGSAFRAGYIRAVGTWYFRKDLPFYLRNFPFAALPSGAGAALLFSVFPLGLIDALWAEFLGLGLIMLVLVCFILAVAFMIRPPNALKPRWILDREQAASR